MSVEYKITVRASGDWFFRYEWMVVGTGGYGDTDGGVAITGNGAVRAAERAARRLAAPRVDTTEWTYRVG